MDKKQYEIDRLQADEYDMSSDYDDYQYHANGEKMTLEAFIIACQSGAFIDYDGHGYYATDTEVSAVIALPSQICAGRILGIDPIMDVLGQPGFTHVVWYNR